MVGVSTAACQALRATVGCSQSAQTENEPDTGVESRAVKKPFIRPVCKRDQGVMASTDRYSALIAERHVSPLTFLVSDGGTVS